MAIKSLNLVWITVSNLEKAENFFTKVLGLKLNIIDKQNGWLELMAGEGGCRLGVAASQEDGCCGVKEEMPENCCSPSGPGTNAVVTFEVSDVIASKDELERAGVKFSGPIMEYPGHVKLASFSDPDGNQFQLVQVLNKNF